MILYRVGRKDFSKLKDFTGILEDIFIYIFATSFKVKHNVFLITCYIFGKALFW
jgi:hypothetical protein